MYEVCREERGAMGDRRWARDGEREASKRRVRCFGRGEAASVSGRPAAAIGWENNYGGWEMEDG